MKRGTDRAPAAMAGYVWLAFAGAACTTAEPLVDSRLDSSGLTVVTLGDPIVLARPAPRLAATARDYAYLGPVEINNMGRRDHYLWLGLATTVDRTPEHAEPPEADAIALLVDGQPMMLPLTRWRTTLDRAPYETALPLYATLAARASLDQIQRVASARSVEVHLLSGSGVAARYRMWQGTWPSWSLFGHRRQP